MSSVIFSQQLAEVTRRLKELGVRDDDPQLFNKFSNAFALTLGGSVVQRASQIAIDLPNLDDNVQADIVKDNVLAVSALYFSAQLEELKFFAVADKVAEQFETSMIPMSRGAGGEAIYRYMRDATNRFTEAERRGIYARAFGFAQGSVDEPMPNREFADLWIRFLSAVSVFTREEGITVRRAITSQQVFKNARDLAVNISLHGYGIAHFAAVELQDLIKSLLKMLSFPDVLAAYGVTDIWQLVERVSGLYLGGSVNSVRQRTLAQSGSAIIKWLAENQPVLANASAVSVHLNKDLVSNVERWLAVTGTDDQATEKYFEPVSMAQQPTIPTMSFNGVPEALQNILPKVTNGAFGQLPNLGAMTVGKA
jgi:hypothetical protein